MSKSFRLCYIPDGSYTRPPKPPWLLSCEATKRAQHSVSYWTKIYWATPPWLCKEQLLAMRTIYLTAGDKHVDHIVPLKSKIVCGLHVPWNLEAIDPAANLNKSNHWWPGHPHDSHCMVGDFEPQQLTLAL